MPVWRRDEKERALALIITNRGRAAIDGPQEGRSEDVGPEHNLSNSEPVVIDLPEPMSIKIGDYVLWTSNGVDQFKQPRRVAAAFDGGTHVQVFGSNTGIPMSELVVVDPPAPAPLKPPSGAMEAHRKT